MNLGALRINDTNIFFREINTETTNNYIYLLILFFYLFYFIYLLFRNLYLIYFKVIVFKVFKVFIVKF